MKKQFKKFVIKNEIDRLIEKEGDHLVVNAMSDLLYVLRKSIEKPKNKPSMSDLSHAIKRDFVKQIIITKK